MEIVVDELPKKKTGLQSLHLPIDHLIGISTPPIASFTSNLGEHDRRRKSCILTSRGGEGKAERNRLHNRKGNGNWDGFAGECDSPDDDAGTDEMTKGW